MPLLLLLVFFLCIPGDVVVDVTDEVAIDSSQFISSTDAFSGTKIATYHYLHNLNCKLTFMFKLVNISL